MNTHLLNTCKGLLGLIAALHIGTLAAAPDPTLPKPLKVAKAQTLTSPTHDDDVIETLPTVTRNRPAASVARITQPNPQSAARAAREAISMVRQSGDNRYWGRAQAALAPWWDRADAPADLAVLQATVQQGRHEFAASRKVLQAALERQRDDAQGWLNLAALERLHGHYPASLAACAEVARMGQALYAQACELETRSLSGEHAMANQALERLATQTLSNEQRGWLLSLLAEGQERAGQDPHASASYQRSLALQADLYTAIACSDLLLRTGKPADALQALATYPDTDAVLLRRATAMRRLGDARWSGLLQTLRERVTELKRRGDDPLLHGRELALIALWLEDEPARALGLARKNLSLQREPMDWWVALASAQKAGDGAAVAALKADLKRYGLNDVRLNLTAQAAEKSPSGKAGS